MKIYKTEIVGHYMHEKNCESLSIFDGQTCSILINSYEVKKCLRSNPLEAMRRIYVSIDSEKQLVDIKWEIVSYGIKSSIDVQVKRDIIVGCEIVNPVIFDDWFPYLGESDVEKYLSAPDQSLKLFYNNLNSNVRRQTDPVHYIAIHTPEREVEFCSAKAEFSETDKVVYLCSVKLLNQFKRQAMTYRKQKNISNKIAEKSGLIEEQEPHWRSKSDMKIFCHQNHLHTTSFMPNELARGVNLYKGNIELTNGRHRIANAIYSGAPYVPVIAHHSESRELVDKLGW